MTFEEIKEEYFANDVVMSELLRSLLEDNDISDDVIRQALEWSGDDEYVTLEDVKR